MKALIVDDDPDLVDLLSYILTREGYSVLAAPDGPRALTRFANERPNVVLLDVKLPGLDGIEVCRRIRIESSTPVLMVTACGDEDDVVRALRIGADDYVRKPFSARELVARIESVMRRAQIEANALPNARELVIGDVVLDLDTRMLRPPRGPVQALSPLECRILHLLASNLGRVITYSRLIEYAWGYYDEVSPSLVKPHVSTLRKKLAHCTSNLVLSATVGTGYGLFMTRAMGTPRAMRGSVAPALGAVG